MALKPIESPQQPETLHVTTQPLPKRPRRLGWAQLLRRVLNVDALSCPTCATPMLVIAFITDPGVIRRILEHLNVPSRVPAIAPAQPSPQHSFDFEPLDQPSDCAANSKSSTPRKDC